MRINITGEKRSPPSRRFKSSFLVKALTIIILTITVLVALVFLVFKQTIEDYYYTRAHKQALITRDRIFDNSCFLNEDCTWLNNECCGWEVANKKHDPAIGEPIYESEEWKIVTFSCHMKCDEKDLIKPTDALICYKNTCLEQKSYPSILKELLKTSL